MSSDQIQHPKTLTPHQRATIDAATARIIPTDQDPGASEAGVVNYIENTLVSRDAGSLTLYRNGVEELDRLAQERFSAKDFCSLDPAQQDHVLTVMEQSKSPFFALLLEHTMEGFYGDPRHGGNKNRVGWKMLGFPGPSHPVGYRPPLGWYNAEIPDDFSATKKSSR